MDRDLARKYRPQRLSDIVGQDAAKLALQAHLAGGTNQSVLLVGPSGTGKTTAARILGASLICQSLDVSPCGDCADCLRIFGEQRFTFGWYEMDGARFSEKKNFNDIAGLVAGDVGFRWSCFVDEIHAVDDSSADLLLKVVEQPAKESQFIGATTDLAAVRPALRRRCKIINFQPLSGSQAYSLLQRVCRQEEIGFEPKALDMIAAASRGSAREALIMLEQVAQQGDVTIELVAGTLSLGSVEHVVRLFDALIAGDANAQEAALYEWAAEPLRKAELIRDYLLYVFNTEVAVPRIDQIVDPAFYMVQSEERGRLVAGLRKRVGSMQLIDYWLALLESWQFDAGRMAASTNVTIAVRKFDRLLTGPGGDADDHMPPPRAATVQITKCRKRAFRARSTKLVSGYEPSTATGTNAYLSLAQAEAIYAAASFLPLSTGTLFNSRLLLNHALLNDGSEAAATALVSKLTHELGMRVEAWADGTAWNWLYVNERLPSGLQTQLILHVPAVAVTKVERWLMSRMDEWCGGAGRPGAWTLDLPDPKRETGWERSRVARHWRLVRQLWRGVNPQIGYRGIGGMKRPLPELLRVPGAQQRPSGELQESRRFGSSRGIAPAARRKAEVREMKVISAFEDRAWDSIDEGWELQERDARRLELATRVESEQRILAEWPGKSEIEAQHRQSALQRLHDSWRDKHYNWPRSWPVWWHSAAK